MKKSVVKQIVDAHERLPPESFLEWMDKTAQYLIEQERTQTADAWRAGNKDGWDMQTDWPEHGELYYDETFKSKTTPA